MSDELGGLKQGLFAYFQRRGVRGESQLRRGGFGTHLDTLYGGSWEAASSDFGFYQFVKTAQSYLQGKSPQYLQRLENELAELSLTFAELPEEDRLIVSVVGIQPIQEELVGALKEYIMLNPPAYDEAYKTGLVRTLKGDHPEKVLSLGAKEVADALQRESKGNDFELEAASSKLLKESLENVLFGMPEEERELLRLRFGLKDGRTRTLEEIARMYNTTREKIRGLEAKALKHLRHPRKYRTRELADYLD